MCYISIEMIKNKEKNLIDLISESAREVGKLDAINALWETMKKLEVPADLQLKIQSELHKKL